MDDNEELDFVEEDYYATLNLPRSATQEEISKAYRNLSRIFHPDKHGNGENKQKAELMFNRTKKAYEVLSDPHQRAIYDSLGVKGLETEGWEIVHRTKTPNEIREEYERLAQEREERRLQQKTNPRGNISVHINATDFFSRYDDDYYDTGLLPSIEVSGMSMSQSIEAPLSRTEIATLSGSLHLQNGVGSGNFLLSGKRLINKGWFEVDCGAGNGPVIIRSTQTYLFPIHLSEEIIPAAIFYATVTPLLTYFVLKKMLFDPMNEATKQKNIERVKETNSARMAEKRKEAESAISLMGALFERIRKEEIKCEGLIIVSALYGKFSDIENASLEEADDMGFVQQNPLVIDVRIPLQCLVKDSQLTLYSSSKSELPGFYDPCFGEEKQLKIDYEFKNNSYSSVFADSDPVRLPAITNEASQ
uniref:J domain-containing protein n=1 Tax=Anopheles culicifacies TaxID=139723 RepID=A0A182MMY3_9DIPT